MKKPLYEPRAEHCTSPVPFAEEVLGVNLWSKQKEVLEALGDHRRVAVKSGNGLGKGYSAAVAILWFLCCHDSGVVLSTAPTFRQVRHVLWREVHRLYHRAKVSLSGKLLDTRLEMSEGRWAMGLSADSDEEFQGFHSPNMLIVVDEAEGVEETIYEAIESIMTSENCRLLLIGNPHYHEWWLSPGVLRGQGAVPHHHHFSDGQPKRPDGPGGHPRACESALGEGKGGGVGRGESDLPGAGAGRVPRPG